MGMLETLRSIVQEVGAASDINAALALIVARVREELGTEVCSVYLYEQPAQRYRFMATEGLNKDGIGKLSLGRHEGLVGLVGERAEPVNLEEATAHPRFHYVPEIGEEPFHAFLGVPILHQGEVLGVLVVQQAARRRFDADEEAFLITLSAQLAGVIAHARATGALYQRGHEVKDAKFSGVAGSPGVVIGHGIVISPYADLDAVPDREAEDVTIELMVFERAIQSVRDDINSVREKLAGSLPEEEQVLFDAYLHMLDDNAMGGEVRARIREGHWAQGALRRVIHDYVANFQQMEDSYLRERATDVRELGQRVLAYLQDLRRRKVHFPDRTILVGREITPAMLGEVPGDKLAGVVSLSGSISSHTAILCRAMGIPSVMGCEDLPLSEVEGRDMIVDGFYGDVYLRPSDSLRRHYEGLLAEEQVFLEELKQYKDEPAVTPDGHRVRLWVNIGLSADVFRSLEWGAEGIGLYRTEIPFMVRDRFPTEEEQRVMYREHLEAFAPRPVTMRTLDIGGDKSLPYFPIREDNPFLGWRGIRVTLDHPEIMTSQVRAMIKANEGLTATLRIMLPMVSNLREIDQASAIIRRCHQEVVDEGYSVAMPLIGCMIEVPSAVYQIREIAKRTDFIAVGSNDLTQYMLAVDRNNSRVADLYQDMHPAVLMALKYVADNGRELRKAVGICGELAGNPMGAVLLTAMGYQVLSMNATHLLKVKWVIRSIPLADSKKMLAAVLAMECAEDVVAYMRDKLIAAGVGRVIAPKRKL